MQSLLCFLFSSFKYSLLENSILSQLTMIVWLSVRLIYRVIVKLTQLCSAIKAWLVELTAYQTPSVNKFNIIVWQRWDVNNLTLILVTNGTNSVRSIEKLRRNARWLEREVSEMFDIVFLKKQDRRALFLTPVLFWGVLKRDFPVGGFFDATLSLQLGRIVITHSNWNG